MSKYLNDAYTLRIPADLKAKVAESAKTHNRSMNADIVFRLEKSFRSGLDALMEAAELHGRRRSVTFGTYNAPGLSGDAAREAAARQLSDFLHRNPDYQLINVEGTESGVRFWYSYPDDQGAMVLSPEPGIIKKTTE